MVLINTKTGEKRDIATGLIGSHYPIGWTTSQELIFLLGQFEIDPGGNDFKQKLTAVNMYKYHIQSGQKIVLGENLIWGAYLPALSLDGSKIALVTEDRKNPPLVVMNSDGTNSQTIGEYGIAPIWSPNGEWIATTDMDENLDTSTVYIVHLDGTNGQAIFQGQGVLPSIFWLPDNQYLLVTTYDDDSDGKFLYLVSIEDGTFQPVTIPGIDPNQYVVQGISLRPLPSAP
jgi:Tol biopolymer transport system component